MPLRDLLFRLYWRLEEFLAPDLHSSQEAYYDCVRDYAPGAVWLDFGCGRSVFGCWMRTEERSVIGSCRMITGIDLDMVTLRQHPAIHNKCLGGGKLPFADNTFDLVTANMVMEHVEDPSGVLSEIKRVLKPRGRLIIHTPNKNGYQTVAARLIPEVLKKPIIYALQARHAKDVFPTHYRLNSLRDIRHHAGAAGFDTPALRFVSTSASFAVIPPLVIFELLLIRQLQRRTALAPYRAVIVGVLQKPASENLSAVIAGAAGRHATSADHLGDVRPSGLSG